MIPKIVLLYLYNPRDGICESCGNIKSLDCPYNRVFLYKEDALHMFKSNYRYVMKETFKGILYYSDENDIRNGYQNKNMYEKIISCPWYRKGIFIFNFNK